MLTCALVIDPESTRRTLTWVFVEAVWVPGLGQTLAHEALASSATPETELTPQPLTSDMSTAITPAVPRAAALRFDGCLRTGQ
jgi:hypothetical protein